MNYGEGEFYGDGEIYAGVPAPDPTGPVHGHVIDPVTGEATMTFEIKQGDTLPYLAYVFEDANGPINLDGAVIRFHMADRRTGAVKVDATGVVLDAAEGRVRYEWVAEDTDTAGVYRGEFQATFDDGEILTDPNDDEIKVRVRKQIK